MGAPGDFAPEMQKRALENKSPRGLNAHLNWRKLPVVHLGVCHPLEKLWGPSPGPPWGHVYHLNNSESPTPKDVFWIRWNSYFLGPLPKPITPSPNPLPPPPSGPIGATLGTAMNNFNSSHKKVFEYYITWLFYFWIWRRCYYEMCMVLALGSPLPGPPWGHMYHMNDFESQAPKDDSCQVCLRSDQAFSRSRWNSYFLHRAPSPTCYPPQGPLGPPWELPWTIFILHLRRSIHTT